MRKINNNYLGNFYIEELENREERDRVKLFDSDENYLDYLPLEIYDDDAEPIKEQYQGIVEMLESFKNIPDLIEWLVCNYKFIGDLDALKNSEWADLIGTEWVNRIGNIYIVISEY